MHVSGGGVRTLALRREKPSAEGWLRFFDSLEEVAANQSRIKRES